MRPRRLSLALSLAAIGVPAFAGSGAAATATPPAVAAQASPSVDLLLRSAGLWEARGRPELARAALEKILRVQPSHADALRQLGLILLSDETPERAEVPLRTLQKLYPGSVGAMELAEAYRIVVRDRKRFALIRLLARAGRQTESIGELRRLFPKGAPRGNLGIEYYRLLALAPASREEARRGLSRLAREAPDDQRYQNALATLLLEYPETRRQGLQLMAQIARRGQTNRERQALWRQGLLAQATTSAGLPEVEQFLAVVPDDRAIRQRHRELLALQRQEMIAARDPYLLATIAAEQALDRGDYATAEHELVRARQLRPADPRQIGLLGFLRLKQGRHAEAQAIFEDTRRLDPGNRKKWEDLVTTARFWGALQAARRRLAAGELPEAQGHIADALRQQAGDPDALVLLAEVQRQQGQPAMAEKTLRGLLARTSTHEGALRSLVGLLLVSGRLDESAELLSRPPPAAALSAWDYLYADYWAQVGEREITAGRNGPALAAYERSLALQADNPWLALDLARLYRRLQLPELGRELLQKNSGNATSDDWLYAQALFAAELDEFDTALAALSAILPPRRSQPMERLRNRIEVRQRVADSQQRLSDSDPRRRWEGLVLLRQAEDLAGAAGADRDELLQSVINAWQAAGRPEQAVRLSNAMLTSAGARDQLLPRHLDLLLDAGREGEFRRLLVAEESRLAATPDGRAILQRADEERLIASADALIATGDGETAAGLLQALLAERPDWPRLRRTLAEARVAQQQPEAALAIYAQLIAEHPEDLASRLDRARLLRRLAQPDAARRELDAATARTPVADHAGRLAIAEERHWLGESATPAEVADEILTSDPTNADAHLLLGRIAEREARREAAAQHYRWAIAAESAVRTSELDSVALALSEALTTVAVSAANHAGTETVADVDGEMAPQLRLAEDLGIEVTAQAGPSPGSSSAQRALAALDERLNHEFAGELFLLDKPGDHGSSKLNGQVLATELRWPLGYERQLFLRADQVQLDDGQRRQNGLMPGFGLNTDHWRFDLGSTPPNFPVHFAVGGVRYENHFGSVGWSFDLAQRPLTSSLLSYSGVKDESTGVARGGVRVRGLEGRIGGSRAPFDGSLTVSWHQLLGNNVDPNQRLQLRAAVGHEWRFGERQRLEVGGVVNVWNYARDLSEYPGRDSNGSLTNPGQGGYYSPRHYVSLATPLTWRSWTDTCRLIASISPALSRADGDQGRGYAAGVGIERDLGANWLLGASLAVDRSESYTPNTVRLYLRHAFGRATARVQERSTTQPLPLRLYADF